MTAASDLQRVINQLAAMIDALIDPQFLFQATVTGLGVVGGRRTVSIAFAQGGADGVFYAGNYRPQVGDTVWVSYTGSTPFVVVPQTIRATPTVTGQQGAAWAVPSGGGLGLGAIVAALVTDGALVDTSTPYVPPSIAAAATDPASTQTLANSIRSILLAHGLAA